jgi:hypothetical protein
VVPSDSVTTNLPTCARATFGHYNASRNREPDQGRPSPSHPIWRIVDFARCMLIIICGDLRLAFHQRCNVAEHLCSRILGQAR